MNRSVKRFMGNSMYAQRALERPLIALHKTCDSPAGIPRRPSKPDLAKPESFGGVPFPVRRLACLAETVLMSAAPLSQRFTFRAYHITGVRSMSISFLHFRVFYPKQAALPAVELMPSIQENPCKIRTFPTVEPRKRLFLLTFPPPDYTLRAGLASQSVYAPPAR